MEKILLQIKINNLEASNNKNFIEVTNSAWFWLALIELLIILFLIFLLIRQSKKSNFNSLAKNNIKNAQKHHVNMENLMNSIHNSHQLYKELSKNCHPDKFVNTDKQSLAEEIFKEISKNKRNYEKLISLKSRAEKELNLTFKS